jgi:hypothetical protein
VTGECLVSCRWLNRREVGHRLCSPSENMKSGSASA